MRTESFSHDDEIDSPPGNILIVDDSPLVGRLLTDVLGAKGYQCYSALNAEGAEEMLIVNDIDLMLTDVNMPGENGLQLMERVKRQYPDIAIIVVTAIDNPETGSQALDLGAFGYIIKPFNNTEILINVSNALIRRRLTMENRSHKAALEHEVLTRTKELMTAIQHLERSQKQLVISQEETINRLAKAAEFRDNETAQHIHRMSRYCDLLARRVGFDEERCELLRIASPMHDIGKIGTLDKILLKHGKHTDKEFEIMKQHAEIGYRILSGSESELLNLGAMIAWTHHEKYDGSGYPRGLVGEDIPLEGRVATIADVFDALTSKRVYKPAFSVDKSIEIMESERGKHFDPELLDLFLESMPHVLVIKDRYADKE